MISVVIPTLDDADGIGPTLGSLTPGLMAGLVREVIFVDGGSRDAIAEIAEATGARLIAAPGDRAARLAAGAAAAKGPWLLFLAPDAALSDDWPEAARRHVDARPRRAAWFPLRAARGGALARLSAGWANLAARLTGRPRAAHGLLVALTVHARARAEGPRRAAAAGGRAVRLDACVTRAAAAGGRG